MSTENPQALADEWAIILTPQRLPDEDFDTYKLRTRLANRILHILYKSSGKHAPAAYESSNDRVPYRKSVHGILPHKYGKELKRIKRELKNFKEQAS